jgi:hypothetical protein
MSIDVITFTPVLETSILADNDVFFVPIEVPQIFNKKLPRVLQSVIVLDGDDQNVDFDLVLFNASATLGTLNAAVSISDADAAKIIGYVKMVASTDANDLINSTLYAKSGIGMVLESSGVSESLWVGGVVRSGTPTYTASGMKIKLGFM